MIAPGGASRLLLRRTLHQRFNPTRLTKRPKSTSSQQHASSPSSPAPTPRTIPGPIWLWLEPLASPFHAYGRMQNRSPYITQLFSTLIIYFLGDLSAQSFSRPQAPASTSNSRSEGALDWYDPLRAVRALTIGGLAAIPGYHWFLWLGNNFNYRSKVLSLGVKVAVNQMAFTPLFNCYFFGMQSALSGAGLREVGERVRNTVPTSWWNSWKVWPAVTAFSFAFVGREFRSIFAGVVAIGWQTYLSMLNQRAAELEGKGHGVKHVAQSRKAARSAAAA
ncbi:hypothetical protein H2201_001944 [Coniosporium apollinis]|uniref:Uncharacterized protein n=2 Tax=Coniosporium TaxID=2810619 RepID=A0ABQ9P156_9PEZI|nr:hypothetical protein H2199_000777 [Cladosporium sp. JES 115]KAJ9667758.1 hypothetical protein H2201_001944 [Coniosporium apollinis]